MRALLLVLLFLVGCYSFPLPCDDARFVVDGPDATYVGCVGTSSTCETELTGCEWWALDDAGDEWRPTLLGGISRPTE